MISDKARRMGETILICCIVTVLTGIWAKGTISSKDFSYQASKQSQVATIAGALRHYQVDHGVYPSVAGGLIFCEPFRLYGQERCLWDLLEGNYLDADSVSYDESAYVYMDQPTHVFIAADIPVGAQVSDNNRCAIRDFEFWCIRLPK